MISKLTLILNIFINKFLSNNFIVKLIRSIIDNIFTFNSFISKSLIIYFKTKLKVNQYHSKVSHKFFLFQQITKTIFLS